MGRIEVAEYRTRLLEMLTQLEADEARGQAAQNTVELDQQMVGRLSRMDAIQQQAMAKTVGVRRGAQRVRINAALARIDEGDYGYCTECGEDIPFKRLELAPTTPTCASCAAG